jgi:hypothetical protein
VIIAPSAPFVRPVDIFLDIKILSVKVNAKTSDLTWPSLASRDYAGTATSATGLLMVMHGHQRRHAMEADDRAVNGESEHHDENHPQGDAPVSDTETRGDEREDSDDGLGILLIGRRGRHAFLRTGLPWMKHAGSREAADAPGYPPVPVVRTSQISRIKG